MAVTFTNIVVGQAEFSIGATLGTIVNVGATQEGVNIGWEPDMVDIEVDQFGDAARVVQSMTKVTVTTTLAEATLINLAHAWGYATGVGATEPGLQTGDTDFNIGLHGVYPEEKVIQFVGNAPGSTATTTLTRTYTCNRAIQYSASEHSLQRAENSSFPTEFRILPNPASTGNEYGTITDQT